MLALIAMMAGLSSCSGKSAKVIDGLQSEQASTKGIIEL